MVLGFTVVQPNLRHYIDPLVHSRFTFYASRVARFKNQSQNLLLL